ncbi:MAG TPA: polysaccharide deacetylase family protein [Spirochaetota bacterium]|nr:polysaccharide deacetylase family protein [Spirochaetota bacterium]
MSKTFLLRYDTECLEPEIKGFLEKAVRIHQQYAIPVTFFCTGAALEQHASVFKKVYRQVKDNPLFDFQDHSYSHVGLGYTKGLPLADLRQDYRRSVAAHKKIFHKHPLATALCGIARGSGTRLKGFDTTDKSKKELAMLHQLGFKMVNSFLADYDSISFMDYKDLGFPDIIGFPSAASDTSWLLNNYNSNPLMHIENQLQERAAKGLDYAVVCHDWVTWLKSPDRNFTNIIKIAAAARRSGFTIKRHIDCCNF